jgi:O-antigen ligase
LRVVVPAVVIGSMITAGVAFGSGALSAVGGLLALLIAIVAPEIGLAILASVFSLKAPPSIPAPGLNMLLVGCLLFGIVLRLPVDRPRLRLSASGLLLAAFVFYIFAQQLPDMAGGYAGDKGHQIGYYFFQVLTGFGTVLAAGYILRGRSPYPVLAAGLFGAAISAATAVATFDNPTPGLPFGGLVAIADLGLRAAGPFSNPNYMGSFLAGTLVGTLGLLTVTWSRPIKWLLIAMALLCVIALVEGQSRGAMIAAFAGTAALVWLRSRRVALTIVGIGVVAAVLIYPAFVEWRLNNLKGSAADLGYAQMAASDETRLGGSLAGAPLFLAEPVFGVGFLQFYEKSMSIAGRQTGIDAHNWYVNVFAEQGSIGGILWLAMLAAVLWEIRARRGVAQMVGFAVFAAFAVGFNFLQSPTAYQTIGLPLLFLIAALTADWGDLPVRQARSTSPNGP